MKKIILFAVTHVVFFSTPLFAQDFLGEFLAPPGPAKTSIRLIGSDSFERSDKYNNTQTSEQRFLLYAPVVELESQTYAFNFQWDHLRLATDRTLKSGARIPGNFYDVMLGGTFKKTLNETDAVAFNVSFGSASDDPFASGGSSTLSSTFSYATTSSPTSKWIYFINYSNNRDFLNNVPLPGLAYAYFPSRDFIGVFGFPFVYLRQAFNEEFSGSFLIFLANYKFELSYRISGPIEAYASLGTATQTFFRETRTDDNHRLFYNEKRTLIGIKSPISENVVADLYGGFISNRSMYERKDFTLTPDEATSFDSRYILGLTLSGQF